MTEIVTYPLDGIQYDAKDAAAYFAPRTSGVYSAEDCFTVAAAGGYTVSVSAGIGWVHPSRFEGYSIVKEETDTLTLSVADATRPRIDRIVLRYDAAARKTQLQVLEGTPDSSPTPPAISRTALVYDLALCDVLRPEGSTSITAGHLTDTRLDESLCGVMRDAVESIPTADLLAAAKARIAELEETASNSAKQADASQKAAAQSEQKAADSAKASKTSETEAKQALEETQQTKDSALTDIETARAQALDDVASATEASKTNAEKSASEATKAEASAGAAATSEGNSKTSEEAAKESENHSKESEAAAKKYLEQVKTIALGAQGWYETAEALKAEVPVGENGWWAIVGDTDTIWTWDGDDGVWKNTATVLWDSVQDKPESYPPDAHKHAVADITDFPEFPTSLPANGGTADNATKWAGLTLRQNHNTSDTWIPVFSSDCLDYILKGEMNVNYANGSGNVQGFWVTAQTSDPGAWSNLNTNQVLLVYE